MISHLPTGVRGSDRFCHDCACISGISGPRRPDRHDQRQTGRAGCGGRAPWHRWGLKSAPWSKPSHFLPALEQGIREAFAKLSAGNAEVTFAGAIVGDREICRTPLCRPAGNLLNVHGIDDILHKVREVFASLYNDRAISYRAHKGFAHDVVALSAGIQRMVRSDIGASGVMFTIDTESGFDQVVFITSSYGLGETVQGARNPDEFYVYKPTLKAGKRAVIRRNLGSKLIQMVFTEPAEKPIRQADQDD